MTDDTTRFSRRAVLAGLGSTAVVAGGASLLADDAVAYTSRARSGGPLDLEVAWRETYNGEVVESNPPGTGNPPAGPVVTPSNVQPGDEGSLAVGLGYRDDAPADGRSAQVWLALRLGASREHGITEPEARAGDDTLGTGELQEHLRVAVWYDSGLAGFGACDGSRGIGDGTIADGSLADVGTALADGVRLDPSSGAEGSGCLQPGDWACLGLRWRLDGDVGNVVQGDSVGFDLPIFARPCDAAVTASPFAGDGPGDEADFGR